MLKKTEKTGYSEAAVAAFITSGALGLLHFFSVDINTLQATNLGVFTATAIGFVWRKIYKAKNNG